ncbi:hypothetical protein NTE_00993 [Candidatus Nitrososphaera evergladensis SR1]|uniref:Uncharacterized protein n=1 Tax=Candidatus Nitrososphaera evergladensis SR1 TaxID=1459636 RepID=A0A075MPC8_9ARCH|nr:hypothetical protein [Candidatus Nitrososphaera evergladensis]AIF83068.1 hypothetical protein NTE_00993 [Candidatus Nitrososphaera evergladensis SR1]
MRRYAFALAAVVTAAAATLFAATVFASAQNAYAHFEHFGHYNAKGDAIGPYYAYEQLDPDYAKPGEPAAIQFSIQDHDGRDTKDLVTMVEVYSGITGERLAAFPWTKQDTGDFQLFYTFPDVGYYQIVLSMATGPANNLNGVDPPRTTLSGTAGCNCDRAVFNAAISNNFGEIWSTAMIASVLIPLGIIGVVLGLVYKRKRKELHANSSEEFVKWSLLLLAIAGGMVHFAIYSEHASLRLEYSIFLITAGIAQVSYGLMYILLTMVGAEESRINPRRYYRKTVVLNLFGLIGTAVLLGLYAYAITFPPPLSPNPVPEDVDLAGILAKSAEAILVVGIIYLMRLEKRRLASRLAETPSKT